jgi:nucleoside-diphosphate-sugar epimerase
MTGFTNTLLTGANGFLGRYIYRELSKSGNVDTLSRSGATWNVDLATTKIAFDKHYDLIVHSAGKAHSLPRTNAEKQSFYDVNVKGTACLLDSLESLSKKPAAFVFISSVAVYGLETGVNVSESHSLKAIDPYGRSKIQAEELVNSWCKKNNVKCSILRLPLIAGENPPGNLGAMIRGIKKGYYFNIGGGVARKSIVLAEDVADIILQVAEIGGTYNLTDGYHPNFKELSTTILKQLNRKGFILNMPLIIGQILGKLGDRLGDSAPVNSLKIKKITSDLTFDDLKARRILGWRPKNVLDGLRI